MALSLATLADVLNSKEVQSAAQLVAALPAGLCARWESAPYYAGDSARRRVIIAADGSVTAGDDVPPLVHQANACVLEFHDCANDVAYGTDDGDDEDFEDPDAPAAETTEVAKTETTEAAETTEDAEAETTEAAEVAETTEVAEAETTELAETETTEAGGTTKATPAEPLWRLVAAAPPRMRPSDQLSRAQNMQLHMDIAAGKYDVFHVEDGTAVTLYWAGTEMGWAFASTNSWDLTDQRWMGTRTFGEYFEQVALASPTFVAASGFTGLHPAPKPATEAAADPVEEAAQPSDEAAETAQASDEPASDPNIDIESSVPVEAAEPRVPTVADAAGDSGVKSEPSGYEAPDIFPDLPRRYCYTLGFRHPELHPFAPQLDPMRMWHIRTYDPQAHQTVAAGPLEGVAGQRRWGGNTATSGTLLDTLTGECANALTDVLAWLDPTTVAKGALTLNRRPVYGYILRHRADPAAILAGAGVAGSGATGATDAVGAALYPVDVIVESPLFRSIRQLVYQRPPSEINTLVRASDRFRYMAYQAMMGGDGSQFCKLFPEFGDQVYKYRQFMNTVVDQMVQLKREAVGRRQSHRVAARCKKSEAARFACDLLEHVGRHLPDINPHLPKARSIYYDAVVRPANAFVFFDAYRRDSATRRNFRRSGAGKTSSRRKE